MSEVVEFADVEAALVAYLKARLSARGDGAKVATRRTTSSPARLVRISRVGGTRRNLVEDSPMVTFECWDVTDLAASALAALVRGEVQALDMTPVGGVFLSWVAEIGGPSYFPHPDTGLSRYQHTQSLAVIGRTV